MDDFDEAEIPDAEQKLRHMRAQPLLHAELNQFCDLEMIVSLRRTQYLRATT